MRWRPGAAQPYTLTDLGNIGYSATATALSTVGGNLEVVGLGQETFSYNYSACIGPRRPGRSILPTRSPPSSATGSQATGVNASGQIVGTYTTSSTTDGSDGFGFVDTVGGTPTEMALPASFTIFSLSGINNSGLVAGVGVSKAMT